MPHNPPSRTPPARRHGAVAVVGAGLVGAAIAWRLTGAGARVTLFDADAPRASEASFGWINASFGNPPDYVRLRARSIALWHELDLEGLAPRWTGSLGWEAGGADLRRYVDEYAALGHAIRRVDRAEIERLEPTLADPPDEAAYCEREGIIDAGAAAGAFRSAAIAGGARIVRTRVVKGDGGLRLADGGPIEAERVVVAAGGGTADLLGLPVRTVSGLLARTRPAPFRPRRVVVTPELIVAPAPDGGLIVGGAAGGSNPADDPEGVARAVVAKAAALFGGAGLEPAAWKIGHRPMPMDGLPIVGPMPGEPRLYAAVTHSGVTLAPLIAERVTSELLDGEASDLLVPYRPGRFVPD